MAAPDFTCLTATERAILALLAQGHTAKSIAAATGRTEGAVNERLREARRKTGVGSSRELARLCAAQENRDGEIGMAPGKAPPPAPAGAPLVARQPAKVILMTLLFLAAAAAVMLHGPGQQAPTPPTPPPVASDSDPGGIAATLRARFAGETRDAAWATPMEAALMDRYRAIGGPDLATLTVACRSSLCSVQGQAVSRIAHGDGRRLSEALASPAIRGSVPGVHADVTNSSSFTRGASLFVSFDALWRRTDRD